MKTAVLYKNACLLKSNYDIEIIGDYFFKKMFSFYDISFTKLTASATCAYLYNECSLVVIRQIIAAFFKNSENQFAPNVITYPAGTLRLNDVVLTWMRRDDVASTSLRCHFNASCCMGLPVYFEIFGFNLWVPCFLKQYDVKTSE